MRVSRTAAGRFLLLESFSRSKEVRAKCIIPYIRRLDDSSLFLYIIHSILKEKDNARTAGDMPNLFYANPNFSARRFDACIRPYEKNRTTTYFSDQWATIFDPTRGKTLQRINEARTRIRVEYRFAMLNAQY